MVVSAVNIDNLVKIYDGKRVLDSLTTTFQEGKITGLLGPNGAGKSTLFKILVGLVKPDGGTVRVFGQSPSWRHNNQIAYLPDRGHWYGFQTVEQALDYAQIIFPLFNRQRAKELASFMELDPQVKINSLSKGQEARLQLIFCLARDVKLILLDEPFSGIDLVSRERIIQGIIDLITDTCQTIVISTHEIHEVESLFDEVVFINEGQVILSEDADRLRSQKESVESMYRRLFR